MKTNDAANGDLSRFSRLYAAAHRLDRHKTWQISHHNVAVAGRRRRSDIVVNVGAGADNWRVADAPKIVDCRRHSRRLTQEFCCERHLLSCRRPFCRWLDRMLSASKRLLVNLSARARSVALLPPLLVVR